MQRLLRVCLERNKNYDKEEFYQYMADAISGVTKPMTDEVWDAMIGESKMNDQQIEATIDKLVAEELPGPHIPVENGFRFLVSQEQDEDDVTLVLFSPEGRELVKKTSEKLGYTLFNKLWDLAISEFNKA